MAFYGLPHPNAAAGAPAAPAHPPPKPQGARFELHTLPVRLRPAPFPISRFLNLSMVLHPGKRSNGCSCRFQIDPKSVADGDTINVYVDTADPRESGSVPREVQKAAEERAKARAAKNYQKADALQKVIVDAGYRFVELHIDHLFYLP